MFYWIPAAAGMTGFQAVMPVETGIQSLRSCRRTLAASRLDVTPRGGFGYRTPASAYDMPGHVFAGATKISGIPKMMGC
jgi:hypothetical protein